MEKVKLGDVSKVITKGTTPTSIGYNFENTGINFVKIESISETGEFLKDKFSYISEECNSKLKRSQLVENDILFSIAGAIGRVAVVNKEIIPANTNQALAIIRIDDRYNKNFLKFLLTSDYIKKQYNKKKQGVAQINLSLKDIAELEIPIIDLEEQIMIVHKIEKVQEIIYTRKKQIEELDKLIKSQFIEMFGSPFYNDKWEIKKIGDIAEIISDGNNIETTYYQKTGDVLFLRIQNVWRNEFKLDDSVYVSKEVNDMYIDTSLHTGDILISKIGRYYTKDSSLGRVSLYRGENDKANYSNNIMRVRLKPEYNSEFVNIVLNLDDYQQHIRRESKGGTDKRALSKKIIENFEIINPPIKLQNEYIQKVKLIDKQKFEIQKSLEKIQKLQESLMNKYFN